MLSDVTSAMGVLKDDAIAAACAARDKDANAVVGEFQGGPKNARASRSYVDRGSFSAPK
tara:strand:- start:311 stop:487 length:177 start_codon:yes stop_codon:yes gene_type:complete